MSNDKQFANMNGQLVHLDQATVHVLSPAVKYASAVFEGIRAYWNEDERELYVFRLGDHVRRLFDSMRLMRFATDVDAATVLRRTMETIRANEHRETIHLRILAYIDGRGDQGAEGPVSFAITTSRGPRSAKFDSGIRLGISSWARISDRTMPPRVKCVANYNNGRLAIMQAKLDGHDNALFLTDAGKVSETPGSCFFIVKDGRLITPSSTQDILEGITRDTVIRLAREKLQLEVVERALDRSEAYLADEAFVCGSRQEILPAVAIDHYPIGGGSPGTLTRALQQAYVEIAERRTPAPEGWCEPVYRVAAAQAR